MPRVKFSFVLKWLLVACSTVLVLLSSEFGLRAFSVDLRLMRKILFYQNALLPLHRTSLNAQRLYELKPGASVQMGPLHSKETKYTKDHKIQLSVNTLGFRGKVFSPIKKAGVFRIMVFGASNTFGLGVSDEDTYPAQMQRILDEMYPGKVEVWNAGVCGYQMSQNVAYAESVVNKFDPDLVILQDTNRGRRPFYYNVTVKELRELFGKNRELFAENIPAFNERDRSYLGRLSNFLTLHSALYRTLYTGFHMRHWDPLEICFDYGQRTSNRDFNRFTERHGDRNVILFYVARDEYEDRIVPIIMRKNLSVFVLNTKGKPDEYRDLHPPSYVHAWCAQELCDFLVQKGFLPAASPNSEKPGSL